jgi:hypothetical protein
MARVTVGNDSPEFLNINDATHYNWAAISNPAAPHVET